MIIWRAVAAAGYFLGEGGANFKYTNYSGAKLKIFNYSVAFFVYSA